MELIINWLILGEIRTDFLHLVFIPKNQVRNCNGKSAPLNKILTLLINGTLGTSQGKNPFSTRKQIVLQRVGCHIRFMISCQASAEVGI